MVEEWKQWPGDSDIYVSSTGVIMSKKRGIWKRLKESKHNRGYSTVGVGGGSQGNIAECLSGRRHTHRGCHFRRVDDR